jgi:hypothetical protein
MTWFIQFPKCLNSHTSYTEIKKTLNLFTSDFLQNQLRCAYCDGGYV